jgi:hypothetical protein
MICFRRSFAVPLAALWWGAGFAIAAEQLQDEAGVVLENPLAVHSLDRMSATRERPLFSPSRRPPAPPAPPIVQLPVIAPPPPPPNVTLFGIVLEADEARALVRVPPKNEMIRVRIGEEIGGWKVTQIDGRKLVLSLDDRLATFTIFSGQGAKAPNVRTPSPVVDKQIPNQPYRPALR